MLGKKESVLHFPGHNFLSSVAKTQHPPNMEVDLGKHGGWAQLCRGWTGVQIVQ
jgi:hypothetical protein